MPGSPATFSSVALVPATVSSGMMRHWTVATARDGSAFSCTPALSIVATQVECRMAFIATSLARRSAAA